MIVEELKDINFTFENCGSITIPRDYINYISIEGITKSGFGANLGLKEIKGLYYETETTSNVKVGIDNSFLENKFIDIDRKVSSITIGERIKKWNDITWISITNKKYLVLPIFNPIKCLLRRKNKTSFLKFRIPNKKYVYNVVWYRDKNGILGYYLDSKGNKRFTDYSNKYQTFIEDSELNTTYIIIKE